MLRAATSGAPGSESRSLPGCGPRPPGWLLTSGSGRRLRATPCRCSSGIPMAIPNPRFETMVLVARTSRAPRLRQPPAPRLQPPTSGADSDLRLRPPALSSGRLREKSPGGKLPRIRPGGRRNSPGGPNLHPKFAPQVPEGKLRPGTLLQPAGPNFWEILPGRLQSAAKVKETRRFPGLHGK